MRTGFAQCQSQKGRAWSLQVRHVLQADSSRQLARWLPWNNRLTSSFPVPASRPAAASRTASSSASQAAQAQRTFCCSRVMRSRDAWYCFCSCRAKQWGWKRGVSNGCASNLLLHTRQQVGGAGLVYRRCVPALEAEDASPPQRWRHVDMPWLPSTQDRTAVKVIKLISSSPTGATALQRAVPALPAPTSRDAILYFWRSLWGTMRHSSATAGRVQRGRRRRRVGTARAAQTTRAHIRMCPPCANPANLARTLRPQPPLETSQGHHPHT